MRLSLLPPRAATWLWSLATLLAAVLATPLDWRAAALAGLGSLGLRQPLWRAVCGASLWACAVLGGHPTSGVLLAAAILLIAAWPTPLALGLAGLGAVLSARASLVAAAFPPEVAAAPALALLGIVLGGCAAGALAEQRAWPGSGALLLAGLGLTLEAGLVARAPLTTTAAVTAALRWDVLTDAQAARLTLPQALWALRTAPRSHVVAAGLPTVLALEAGWRPEGAALSEAERLTAARWLEARGRGGEAMRLLRAGGPESRWWLIYLQRTSGYDVPRLPDGLAIPPEVIQVPGAVLLLAARDFLREEETAVVPFHAAAPLAGLEISFEAEWFEGAPTLEWRLDGGAVQGLEGPPDERLTLRWRQTIAPGPHRLVVRLRNDRFEAGAGDRNLRGVTVAALAEDR